jgi:phosphoenolpyruvate carboxykinase (GTP)
MGDYFGHWLSVGAKAEPEKLPKIYYVNWFRKGADGSFLWPGFGENSRVLKWIVQRLDGAAEGTETAIGVVPTPADLDLAGLHLDPAHLAELLSVDPETWRREAALIPAHFERFGAHLPEELWQEHRDLVERLG